VTLAGDAPPALRLPTRHHLYLLGVVALVEAANRVGSPRLADGLAGLAAAAAHRWSHEKRRRMERNVTRALGPLDDAERARIVRGAFHTFWDETLGFVPWRAAKTAALEVTGLGHLEDALAAGRGAILWESAYFGRRNLAKQALGRRGVRIQQVHNLDHRAGFARDPHASWLRDAVVFPYFEAREREFTAGVIRLPRAERLGGLRQVLAALARNEVVSITADVAQGHRFVTVPVLGEPKPFATGMVSAARTAGAALLPLFCVREAEGRLRVIVEPAIPVAPERTPTALEAPIGRYAALLEAYIRRYPEQFRDWHYPWWDRP
jgi:KDO2-lipid IV(A) lauroyltransferase